MLCCVPKLFIITKYEYCVPYNEGEETGLLQVWKWWGKQNSMSGKSQGILLSHRKFEEKSGKIEIIWHSWFNTIEGWKKLLGHCDQCQWYFSSMKNENLLKMYQSQWTTGKDIYKLKPEALTRSDILYLFGWGNFILYEGKVVESWKLIYVSTIEIFCLLFSITDHGLFFPRYLKQKNAITLLWDYVLPTQIPSTT